MPISMVGVDMRVDIGVAHEDERITDRPTRIGMGWSVGRHGLADR